MNRPENSLLFITLAFFISMNLAYAETADRNKPLHLEANRVLIDDAKKINRFEGNVQMTQGTLLIQADSIEVTEDAAGMQRLIATGHPVKFRQRYEGSSDYAEGYGNRIEYDTNAETVDFYDHARIKRGTDEVQGAHIAYSTKTEIFQARGAILNDEADPRNSRVHAVIQPKRKEAPSDTPLVIQPIPELPAGASDHE
ncbi:MAG: lipopolysaccharide transport periplasmic protein LptA [Sideroxydans sp.]|nr:lipopolysaccharide transport periplasmic protein LptA [Sideroxydans sp.]